MLDKSFILRLVLIVYCIILVFPFELQAQNPTKLWGSFAGIVTNLNATNNLLKVKFEFTNRKYLILGDKVEFWSMRKPLNPCIGKVVGKGFDEVIFKVPYLDSCLMRSPFRLGAHLDFFSQDLVNHVQTAQKVLEILQKKRLALTSKINTIKSDLNAYMDRVAATNEKFTQQTTLIEQQWTSELTKLEQDKLTQLNELKNLELRLFDTDVKMEQYFYKDKNFEQEQWALK